MLLIDIQKTSTSDNYSGQSQYIPLKFWEAIKVCFNKYADFTGRASRSENWWFVLFSSLMNSVASFIDYSIAFDYYNSYWEYISFGEWGVFEIIQTIAIFLPSLAVAVRRLHDVNRNGWNFLWAFTVIGIFPLLYWSIKAGDDGKNIYGNNPLKKKKTNEVKVENDKPKDVEKSKAKKEAPATDADQISGELQKYKQMLKDGLISQTDYNAKKKKILGI
jgi:uncharacterized membrane protein YhaH (DUF805 family)